jgi:menaquinone-dependent protoporphyrinogen IX oxidase
MTNILVVNYSRTGITSRIGRELATRLDADFERIEEIENRAGVVGFLISAFESLAKGLPAVRTSKNPNHYDLVVVGTPVWAGTMSAPVRAYLHAHRAQLPRMAFFATMRGSGADDALREMRFLCRADDAPSCSFTDAEVNSQRYAHKLMDFARTLKHLELKLSVPLNPAADVSTWVGDIEPAGQFARS